MKSLISVVMACAVLTGAAQTYLSPYDLDWGVDSKTLFVTAQTGSRILMFNTETRSVTGEIPFEVPLNGTAVSADGKTLYVTGGEYDGFVFVVDAASGKIQKTISTGHSPTAPVLSPDGKTLYVCNRFNNNIAFIDLASGTQTALVDVLREPIAADITPDGKWLFVANHNPDGPADVDYVASKISAINTQTKKVSTIKLVNGSEGVRGVKVSPDGKYVYATHFMARFLVPTTQLERGWVSTDALSVIHVSDCTLQYTVLLDDVDQGFCNPWAIGFSGDGKSLLVTAAGSHEISLIDLPSMTKRAEAELKKDTGGAHLNAHNNLSFLSGIRRRIQLPGNGPRSLVVDGTTAYVAHYFSDSIDCVDFSDPAAVFIESVELNPGTEITQVRQGEIYFNDSSLCFQKWLSCATCHPDGRTDALNWDLLNDGIGNPKNVKTMLLAHQTPRAMSLGVRADAETAVRAGLKYIQFAVRPEKDAQAIDAYLKSLTPLPSPYLVKGKLSESAQRGKELFESFSCISCHPAPLYTNLEVVEVGTTKGQDTGKPVDVPSLIEVWRTAPYLHDGRAATIHDVLKSQDHAGILKDTKALTNEERNDLAEYILSL